MKKLSIAKRLYLGLGLVIVVGLGMTVAALMGMDRLKVQWENLKGSSLVKLDLASDSITRLGGGVHAFKNIVLRGDDYRPKALEQMSAIEGDIQRYEMLGATEGETKYLRNVRSGVNDYKVAIEKAAALKREGMPISDVDKSVKGADKPIADAIEELKKIVAKDVEESSRLFQAKLEQNKTILLIGLGVSALFGALLGYTLVRSIKSGLAVANAAIEAVAKGDFSHAIDRSRKDEIGQLLNRASDMTDVLKAFLASQEAIAQAHNRDGRIGERIDESRFSGAYREMAHNLNEMVKGHIEVQTQFVDLMAEYVDAKFDKRMAELPGERRKISDAAEKIRANLEAAHAAQFNALVKAALDHVSIPVRIANEEGRILYMNNAMKDTLRKHEAALRGQLPGFNPDTVAGGSAGMFYPDGEAAIERLRKITSSLASRLLLGGRKLRRGGEPGLWRQRRAPGNGRAVDRRHRAARGRKGGGGPG